MNEYLLKIRGCIDLLGLVGHSISEKEHIDAIFEGLSTDNDTFILSIESLIDPYTVDDIESLLLAQEARIKKKNKKLGSAQPSLANIVVTGQNSKQSTKRYINGFTQNSNSSFGGLNTFGGQSFYGKQRNFQNNARGGFGFANWGRGCGGQFNGQFGRRDFWSQNKP